MNRPRAVGLFVLLGLLWGGSFPAITVGLRELPPVGFAALRYDVAAVVLLAVAAVVIDRWVPRTRRDVAGVVAAGVFLVAGNGLLFVGQQSVPSGAAAIVFSLVPILTTLFSRVVLPDAAVSRTVLAGAVLGVIGVALVANPDPTALLSASVVGNVLIVGAATSVALGSVLLQRVDPHLDDVALTGWAMVVGGGLLHAASAAVGESFPAATALAPAVVGAIAYLGLFATAAAFLVYFSLLRTYGSFQANLVSYLVPVVATLTGVVLLNETIGSLAVAGFLVVFAGFAVMKRQALRALLLGRSRPA